MGKLGSLDTWLAELLPLKGQWGEARQKALACPDLLSRIIKIIRFILLGGERAKGKAVEKRAL